MYLRSENPLLRVFAKVDWMHSAHHISSAIGDLRRVRTQSAEQSNLRHDYAAGSAKRGSISVGFRSTGIERCIANETRRFSL
jgi:hypothetical protein